MRVLVTVDVRPSTDRPPPDELRRRGAAAVINDIVGRAVDATGPQGERLVVADSRVAAHLDGVEVRVVIDTPDRSAPVGELVGDLVAQILGTTPALSGWAIGAVTAAELPAPATVPASRPRRARLPRTRPGRR